MNIANLTDQQANFFDTFGYLGFPGLMADRIEEITHEFEAVWEVRGGGHFGQAHDGKARSCIVPFIDQREYLCTLLDDPRILGIAFRLLGDDFNYMGSDGNYYVGDTGWHSDGWHPEMRHIKIAFYLDPVGRDTGCLRVIPGSHLAGDRYAEKLQEQSFATVSSCSDWKEQSTCRRAGSGSPATCSASTTTPSTPRSAAATGGECSPSISASGIPKVGLKIFEGMSAGTPDSGSIATTAKR